LRDEARISYYSARQSAKDARTNYSYYLGLYNQYYTTTVPNKQAEVTAAEDIQKTITELQAKIDANTINVTVEMTYTPKENYVPTGVDENLINLTYEIMKAIVYGD
jgi:hypothetical protein